MGRVGGCTPRRVYTNTVPQNTIVAYYSTPWIVVYTNRQRGSSQRVYTKYINFSLFTPYYSTPWIVVYSNMVREEVALLGECSLNIDLLYRLSLVYINMGCRIPGEYTLINVHSNTVCSMVALPGL